MYFNFKFFTISRWRLKPNSNSNRKKTAELVEEKKTTSMAIQLMEGIFLKTDALKDIKQFCLNTFKLSTAIFNYIHVLA